MAKKTQLTGDEILKKISKKLKKYNKKGFNGKFTMYMGRTQLLEIALKSLLARKYNCDIDKSEKWSLGRTKNELEERGLRKDFATFLSHIVESRNYIAHSLLADSIIVQSILKERIPKRHYSKQMRFLDKSIIELEQAIYLFKWIDKNDAWV